MARKRQSKSYKRAKDAFLAEVKHECHYCGVKTISKPNQKTSTTVDHILPQETHPHLKADKSNFVVACGSCNSWKSNMSYEAFKTLIATKENRDYKVAA